VAKKKASAAVPWGAVVSVAHAAYDVATQASCPKCGSRVVVYICTGCKKPVKPVRRKKLLG
jgi:DNA-directed RNA polymerase subunit RPC12/RpoP